MSETPRDEAPLKLFIAPHEMPGALPLSSYAANDAPGDAATLDSIEEARAYIDRLRREGPWPAGGILVEVGGGDYCLEAPLTFTEADSGTSGAPVVYRAAPNARVRLLGAKRVDAFEPISDPAVRERLKPEARDKVLEADLHALGIEDFGCVGRRGFGRPTQTGMLQVYVDGMPLRHTRYPKTDWLHIAAVPKGKDGGVFSYDDPRPGQWAPSADLWVHGYWTWDWADSTEYAAKLDTERQIVETEPPHGVYGYKEGARFYFLNIIEELDAPGEFFADKETGKLYIYPPSPLEEAEVLVSVLDAPLVQLDCASHLHFEGFVLEGGRGHGIRAKGGEGLCISRCTVRNMGMSAIVVHEGRNHTVDRCLCYHLGEEGVSMTGGDRMTLTSSGHAVTNCEVYRFSQMVRTYRPAIRTAGVGVRAAHNVVHDAPHMAIALSGCDHTIEYNEVHHVCMETHDAGAFYMGRDWSMRGNRVRFNFFHHLGNGDVQAVYLDDWASGVQVYGNIIHGAYRGVLVGGGRDNEIENNIFLDCEIGVHIDQRGIGWASYYFDGRTNTLHENLEKFNATGPIYTAKYPALKTLLDDDPALAKYNVVQRNVFVDCENWMHLRDELALDTPYLTVKDNFTGDAPGFVDRAVFDLRLVPDAAVLSTGFEQVPQELVGPRATPGAMEKEG